MKIAQISLPLLLTVAACGSSSKTQDPGLAGDGDTAASTAPDTNPDGVAYPSDHLGTSPRQGNNPGDRIKNYKFMGYPDGDVSQGLQPISLANYFDPTGTRYKLIHIQASGAWCIHCKREIEAASPIKGEFDARKVVWIVSLAEGDVLGQPSTEKDLDGWIQSYKPPFTHLLDPGNHNLGPFYDDAALPWNANISAKTMEILTAQVGANESADGNLKELDDALAEVDAPNGLK
jgi:hypothetical protein